MAITGTVKWYNDRLGYGFLQREDGEDVFVHYTEVENAIVRTLFEKNGQFELY